MMMIHMYNICIYIYIRYIFIYINIYIYIYIYEYIYIYIFINISNSHTHIYIYIYIYIYLYRTAHKYRLNNIFIKSKFTFKTKIPKIFIISKRIFLLSNWLSSSSSSSCRAASTDIPDHLPPLLPIVYWLWQVFRATSHILTQLLYVCSSWSSCFCLAICGVP